MSDQRIRMQRLGVSQADVAAEWGCTRQTVAGHLKRRSKRLDDYLTLLENVQAQRLLLGASRIARHEGDRKAELACVGLLATLQKRQKGELKEGF